MLQRIGNIAIVAKSRLSLHAKIRTGSWAKTNHVIWTFGILNKRYFMAGNKTGILELDRLIRPAVCVISLQMASLHNKQPHDGGSTADNIHEIRHFYSSNLSNTSTRNNELLIFALCSVWAHVCVCVCFVPKGMQSRMAQPPLGLRAPVSLHNNVRSLSIVSCLVSNWVVAMVCGEKESFSAHPYTWYLCTLGFIFTFTTAAAATARGLIKIEIFYIYYTTRTVMCMTVSNEIFSSLFSYIISTQYSSKNIFTLVSVLIISRVQILSIVFLVTFIFLFFYFFYVLPLCIISFM